MGYIPLPVTWSVYCIRPLLKKVHSLLTADPRSIWVRGLGLGVVSSVPATRMIVCHRRQGVHSP